MVERIIDTETGKVKGWVKQCPHCKKEFQTTSRRQKYCCADCAKKHNKKLKEDRERYSKVKNVERLRVRSHKLAVDTIDLLVSMGVRKNVCECCGREFDSKNLREIHHVDRYNWMNNTPSNLMILCKKCHAKVHSEQEEKLNDEGILLTEWYEKSMEPFYRVLNKNSK